MSLTKNPGRFAGLLYLLGSIPGWFALEYVPGKLLVQGNATATVNNIAAHELLFRFGIAAELICQTLTKEERVFVRFTTARAHNLLYAPARLEDTIGRLQAFEKAGADVLFAPALPDLAAVRAVCTAVAKPLNFMVGIKGNLSL